MSAPASTITPVPGLCWWCGAAADSREHKYKRSDLVREHGKAPYDGPATLVRVGDRRAEMRSSKSAPLTFEASLCAPCNNRRSQPCDMAYDAFIEWLWANEEQVLEDRGFRWSAIFGTDWRPAALNVFRYFVKHIGCRVAEISTAEEPYAFPASLVRFLDGGPPPQNLYCEFFAELTWVRFMAAHPDDPLWNRRPVGLGPVFVSDRRHPPDSLWSEWRYGWLTFGWRTGQWVDGAHPFGDDKVPVPLVAAFSDPSFEWALSRAKYSDDEPPSDADDRPEDQGAGEPPDKTEAGNEPFAPPGAIDNSPVILGLLVGALDLEGGPGRVADHRTNHLPKEPDRVDDELELRRARLAVGACEALAAGRLDEASVVAAARSGALNDVDALRATADRIRSQRQTSPVLLALRSDFAAMATLKLVEALLERSTGADFVGCAGETGKFAGACVMAAALYADDPGRGFDVTEAPVRELSRA